MELVRGVGRVGLRPAAAGLLIGLVSSLAVNRLMEAQLVGVSAADPLTLAFAAALIFAALARCWTPVRRALRGDSVVALRHL
jgi:hypothetical protein